MRRRNFLSFTAAAALIPAASVRAQQSHAKVRVGFLTPSLANLRKPSAAPFFTELRRRGWREGVDFTLEAREHHGDTRRAITLAKELVAMRVDVLVAITTGSATAARAASDAIPIAALVGYPVETGLASSLSQPGGNVTGVAAYANAEVWGKIVELLREIRPGLHELAVLWDYLPPAFPDGLVPIPEVERAAKHFGIKTTVWKDSGAAQLNEALSAVEQNPADAVIVSAGGGVHIQQAELIGDLLARRRLPAITDFASPAVFEKAGCVLAYSPDSQDIYMRLASFADRLLRGANPAELPFELPARFQLVVNAKAAHAIGLAIPQSLLLRADRVIE